MRRNLILISVIALPFLVSFCWWATHPVAFRVRDLSVEFIGYTNNPVETMRPVRVCVIQDAVGRCVLFRVKNVSPDTFIGFDTVCVETNDGSSWKEFKPAGHWQGVGGDIWAPSYSCFYAVAWPPGLETNVVWRMRLKVVREPSGWRQAVNQFTHRKIFGDYARDSTASSEVNQ